MPDDRAAPRIRVRCVCGWGAVDVVDLAVDAAVAHGQRAHNMIATRDVVLASAEWLEPAAAPGETA